MTIEDKNKALFEKFNQSYEFKVLVKRFKLSPIQYQNMNPSVRFAFVPRPEGRWWFFREENDMAAFKKQTGETE